MTTPSPDAGATAAIRFFGDDGPAPRRIYLDTSILLDLFEHDAATKNHAGYKTRPDLVGFLESVQRASGEILTTPLALAEAFGRLNWRVVTKLITKHSCQAGGEKELRRKHPDEHADARKGAAQSLRHLVKLLRDRGARISSPIPNLNETPGQLGRRLADRLVQLVERCRDVGGPDALHVVLGASLGCDNFVSRDGDYETVPGITVFRPRARN